MKLPAILSKLSVRLTGHDNWRDCDDGLIHLGAGYWRVTAVLKEPLDEGKVIGFKLINPDRTSEEIEIITQAMNLLL